MPFSSSQRSQGYQWQHGLTSCLFLNTWCPSKGCGARGLERNANCSLSRQPNHHNPSILAFGSRHFFPLSEGSEGNWRESIRVKTKGAEKTPGTSATCVSIYMWESQGRRDLFEYTTVCVRERERETRARIFLLFFWLCVVRSVCFHIQVQAYKCIIRTR